MFAVCAAADIDSVTAFELGKFRYFQLYAALLFDLLFKAGSGFFGVGTLCVNYCIFRCVYTADLKLFKSVIMLIGI